MKRNVFAALISVCLLLVMLPAALAAEYGEANITPRTTMREIRQNPSIAGSGIFTYGNADDQIDLLRLRFQNETLTEYVGQEQAEDCAAALNMVVENYNAGRQVTYKIYTDEEIAAVPSRASAELYYFPAEQANAKYAVVLGGNIAFTSGELREGMATAAQLHELGYAAFVLRYRTWMDTSDNAPLEDLARAVAYITAHADELGVQAEDYALVGYSSGGQIEGVFANRKRGYSKYQVAKPAVLLLGYSVSDTSVMKPVYHGLYDLGTYDWRYYWTSLDKAVEEGYPPVYFWRGNDDTMLGPACMPGQYDDFEKALQACNVPYERVTYDHAPHCIGTGKGTDAEGWVQRAVAFWEEQTKTA